MKHAAYMREFARNLITNALDGDEEKAARVFTALDAAGSFLPDANGVRQPDLTKSATIATIEEVLTPTLGIKMQKGAEVAEAVVNALEERNQLRRPHPFAAFQQRAHALNVPAPWSAAGAVLFADNGKAQIIELIGPHAEGVAEFAAQCVNTCSGFKVQR